jgi:hypothetical protein
VDPLTNQQTDFNVDTDAPYSYLEWKDRNAGYDTSLYNKYVADWFVRHKQKPISKRFLIRQKYLYMLNQLQIFFNDDEIHDWYNKLNLADDNELLLSIPVFAKKLKRIALYYLKLRKKLKNTKVRYNLIGSKQGLETEIQHRLFDVFTTLNEELPPPIQQSLVSPETLTKKINVELEEYYDDTSYFDKTPVVSLSSYIDLLHEPTAQLFSSKGLALSSSSWLFDALSVPTFEDVDSFVATLTGNIFETTDADLYKLYIQKFLNENRLFTTFDSASTTKFETTISLVSGNNRFYYPYGFSENTIKLDYVLDSVPLSTVVPANGVASTSIEGADTIYVKKGSSIEGAWLRFKEFEEAKESLECHIKSNEKTSFIFPYPGYGLSGEDVEWTGNSLSATYEYDFLSEEYKSATHKAYWNQTLPDDTVVPVLINNTTLTEDGATPNKNPNFADQLFVSVERPLDSLTMPGKDENGAWLYKFEKTSIPVSLDLYEDYTLVWPYEYVSQQEDFPEQFKDYNFENVCEPVAIQDLNIPFAVAGSTFETAEKVYKLAKYDDSIENAIECCWLSGQTFTTSNSATQYVAQNGFSGLFFPNTPSRFVWTGQDNTPLSSVFGFVQHSSDCEFLKTESNTDPTTCTCKQVYYSPYGHPGEAFTKYNSRADYILIDKTGTLDAFDLGSWSDSNNKKPDNSNEFAWFKTNTKQTWGDGQWVSGDLKSQPFSLKTGQVYIFNRSDSRDNTTYPPYSVNFRYPQALQTKWIQAKKTADSTWVSADKESTTKFTAGDFIKWNRSVLVTNYLLSASTVENETTKLSSLWTTYDQIALSSNNASTVLNFPFAIQVTSELNTQLPLLSAGKYISFTDVAQVYWWKLTNTSIPNSPPLYIYDDIAPTFTPTVTGTYVVEVSAQVNTTFVISTTGTEQLTQNVYFNSSTIPKIFVLPKTSPILLPVELQTPTSGFLLEQPLRGWNYNTKTYDYNSYGGRPYWATLYFSKDGNTKSKGLYVWGYGNEFVNDYLPNFSPKVSNAILEYGNVFSYYRQGGSFTWHQPITFKTYIGKTEWCQITATPTTYGSLSSLYSVGFDSNPAVFATFNPTPITLTNYDNGHPVEIAYNAMLTFDWTLSVDIPITPKDPTSLVALEASNPWSVLSNRFNPTVATAPQLLNLYTKKDVGGYFTPERLGASQYINKQFTAVPLSSNNSFSIFTDDTTVHIGGRGLTNIEQSTIYTWSEDNRWLKEPPTTNNLVGAVKKNLSKTLQTFVPYQASNENKQFGLNQTNDRKSPWGGTDQQEWTDTVNSPVSFTGLRSVPAWTSSQISNERGKVLNNWAHDVYGTEYGLFKESLSSTYGEMWVRKPNQLLSPSYVCLSAIYSPVKDLSLSVYNELTGNGIKNIECFGDTLMFETSGAIVFAKVTYDYDADEIQSSLDDIKFITIANELSGLTTIANQTWYFPEKNKIICSFTNLSSSQILPELYELNTTTNSLIRQFPTDENEEGMLTRSLSSLSVKTLQQGLLTYNKNLHQYLLTIAGTQTNNTPFIVDVLIDQRQYFTIADIKIYKTFALASAPYLINFETVNNVNALSSFAVTLSSTEVVNEIFIDNDSLSAFVLDDYNIRITGTLELSGYQTVICKVSNSAGSNQFPLTFNSANVDLFDKIQTITGNNLITITGNSIIPIQQ